MLTIAAGCGFADIVQQLVSYGADVYGWQGERALEIATRGNDMAMVRLLLGYKIKLDSALVVACEASREDDSIAKLLLEHGADANEEGAQGYSALYEACVRPRNNSELIKILLAHGGDPSVHNCSLLAGAVEFTDLEVITMLLAKGANTDHRPGFHEDEAEIRPLQALTCNQGFRPGGIYEFRTAIAEALINHGADVNAVRGPRGTALQWAVKRRNLGAVEWLLAHGADVLACGRGANRSVLQLAMDARLIKSRSTLQDIVNILLKHGADVNANYGSWGTPLLIAARNGYRDIARSLLMSGADVNARRKDGETSLHLTAERGDTSFVRLLLAYGADDTLVGEMEALIASPITLESGDETETSAVAQQGYEYFNETPVETARRCGFRDIVKILEAHAQARRSHMDDFRMTHQRWAADGWCRNVDSRALLRRRVSV
jgi:ankyrin repeat protein